LKRVIPHSIIIDETVMMSLRFMMTPIEKYSLNNLHPGNEMHEFYYNGFNYKGKIHSKRAGEQTFMNKD